MRVVKVGGDAPLLSKYRTVSSFVLAARTSISPSLEEKEGGGNNAVTKTPLCVQLTERERATTPPVLPFNALHCCPPLSFQTCSFQESAPKRAHKTLHVPIHIAGEHRAGTVSSGGNCGASGPHGWLGPTVCEPTRGGGHRQRERVGSGLTKAPQTRSLHRAGHAPCYSIVVEGGHNDLRQNSTHSIVYS